MYITGSSSVDTGESISLIKTPPDDETRGNFTLRGYGVPYVIVNRGRHNITLCRDESVLSELPVEFRWLQTSSSSDNRSTIEDVIALDNISISLHNGSHYASLFKESFDDQKSVIG